MPDRTVQTTSTPLKLPEAQPQATLPEVATRLASSLSSVLKLPAPITLAQSTDPEPTKPGTTSKSGDETVTSVSDSPTKKNLLALVTQRAGEALSWVSKKASELFECRSLEDLGKWGKKVFNEAVTGVKNLVSDIREFLQDTRPDVKAEAAAEKAHEFTQMLTELAASADEQKAERKRASREEAEWERSHRPSVAPDKEKTRELEHVARLSPRSADRAEIEDLKIAITTNHIPTENMPEVRRFLAAVEAEKDRARRDQKPGSES